MGGQGRVEGDSVGIPLRDSEIKKRAVCEMSNYQNKIRETV